MRTWQKIISRLVGTAVLLLCIAPLPVWAADSSTIDVRAVVDSPGFCIILAPSATLDFGSLDPLSPVDVNAATTIDFWCFRLFAPTVTYFVSDDDGLNETGPNANRMIHTTNPAWFLPYSFTVINDAATIPRFTVQTLNISGSISGVNYAGALRGDYVDTVTISITP